MVNKIITWVLGAVVSLAIVGVVILLAFGVFDNEKVALEDNSAEYYITNYTTNIVVNKDNTIDVEEEISAHFIVSYKHGIYRSIPEISTTTFFDDNGEVLKKLKLRNSVDLKSANTQSQFSHDNAIYLIRLGNENIYLPAGADKTYRINYTITLDSRYAEFNQFYFNVLGNLWDTDINNFSATITFAEGVDAEKSVAYWGSFGSTDTTEIVWNTENTTATITKSGLTYGQGITLFAPLPDGYFAEKFVHYIDIINLVAILLIAIICVIVYKKYSNKKLVIPVVQFKIDKKYTSADVGYIIDKKVNNSDIASLFIYWASKGYLEIIEEDKKTYIRKLKDADKGMKQYEINLFNAVFTTTERIDIKTIGENIAEILTTTRTDIIEENKPLFNAKASIKRGIIAFLTSLVFGITLVLINYQNCNAGLLICSIVVSIGLFLALMALASNRDKQWITHGFAKFFNRFLFLAFLVLILVLAIFSFDAYCDFTLNALWAVGLVYLTAILIYYFNVRTDEGTKELGDIIGLKDFIVVAEQSRLEMLAKDNPSMFYDIMPFAYVLGVYDEWCKRFEKIVVEAPDWYQTDGDFVFDVLFFSAIMNSMSSDLLSSINTAQIAQMQEDMNSGGGFSGGGFSGGGIGGGGGGSW